MMRKRVVIRLHPAEAKTEASWVVLDGTSGEQPTVIQQGSVAELDEVTVGARVVLLVPGIDVLLLQAAVPPVNQRKLLSAVPYALEDQLAGDVDQQHFATGSRNDVGLLNTAVVEHERLKDWLFQLKVVGVQTDMVVPDVLAMPYTAGQWTLFLEDHSAMLRTGLQTGLVMDASNASLLYESALRSAQELRPKKVVVYDFRTVADDQSELWLPQAESLLHVDSQFPASSEVATLQSDPLEVEIIQPVEPAIGLLADALDESQVIDLLQGDYSRREQVGKLWRPWRLAAGLLMGLLVVQWVQGLMVNSQLKNEVSELREQVKDRYVQSFPNAKRVVNARAQMESKLKALRGGGEGGQGVFLALLEQVASPLSQAKGVALQRFAYRAGKLNVTFEINNLQQLDQLKQSLVATGGLTVDIQSASARKGKVEARLLIEQSEA
ncbi:MAG: type II secretion system protein GspL [Gammaproteobacteria bacterium]|nr:type II secretion system protein GspL [Gammaproteobacteria bacterium]